MTSLLNPVSASSSMSAVSSANPVNADLSQAQDRFLKLLVAQLNNQDPMNPMDNAQMTSQMAQINTVTGIQQLNQTMKDMAQSFSATQSLQAVSLVGREVLLSGNSLTLSDQTGRAAFELVGPADSVKVEILSPGGQLIDTLNLGPQNSGRIPFEWRASELNAAAGLNFKVTATQAGQAVAVSPLERQRVMAVGFEQGVMKLELSGQKTASYASIKAYL